MTSAENIRRRQRETNGLLLVVVVLLLVAGAYQFLVVNPRLNEEINQNAQALTALCAERDQLKSQVAQSQHFLAHPEDFPGFNSPKILALTRAQVQSQQQTIAAFSVLACD